MSEPRITIIGAGSIVFSMTVIRDILAEPGLAGSSITLVDIDQGRLDAITELATRLSQELDAGVRVTSTTDRTRALDGADFVINSAALGERDLWPANRDIARRHGYWASKGFRITAPRNTPIALAVARDMERLCPDAWLLQFANPMVPNVGAVSRHTKIKVAGFCHGVPGTVRALAAWMGLDAEDFEVEAVGINHFIFITALRYQAEDFRPRLASWLDTEFPSVWETAAWTDRLDLPGPISLDLYHKLGLFPCNGDEHMSDYFAWYTCDEQSRAGYRAKTSYLEHYLARGDRRWARIAELASDRTQSVTAEFPARSHEAAAPVINGLWNGSQLLLHVNLPNRGAIPSLPYDTAVELPALVDGGGIRPVPVADLPDGVAAHIRRRIVEEELGMQAAIEQRRDLLLQALYLDPYTRTADQAEAYLDDVAHIEKTYVPWLA